MLKMFSFISVSISILALNAQADLLPVYKFVMKENSIIAAKCTDEDKEKISSKMAAWFKPVPATEKVEMNLKIKACTHKYGMKKFLLSLPLPNQFFDSNWLLSVPVGQSQVAGKVRITRLNDKNGTAFYSISPDSFGSKADGVQSIKVGIPNSSESLLKMNELTQNQFMWTQIQVTYKGGFLMPTVVLDGDLQLVEAEEVK